MWECQWRELKKQKIKRVKDGQVVKLTIQELVDSWNIVDVNPIDFREAFFCERTNAVSLYRDLEHF
jgi:hypothetical protein